MHTHRAAEVRGLLDLIFTRAGLLTTDLVKLEKQVMVVRQLGWQFDHDFIIKLWLSKRSSANKKIHVTVDDSSIFFYTNINACLFLRHTTPNHVHY